MPGRDGKGPDGKGPMTGRKAGRCGGNKNTEDTNQLGRGIGTGGGRGRGLGKGPRDGSGPGASRGGKFNPPLPREKE
ncbi:MAG: hypothetical protein CVV44_14015 [Spirochaetae bacterium HGW-Spirochaetae-1]|jgi:hypothetical protein|nr:MAG: hypothetical protein CVV44_14015 [Spirochaetae bacterium HGW-Spirochaetae-1]